MQDIWRKITSNLWDVAIVTHHNPDGDAIGACFALAHALYSRGFVPRVVLDDYSNKFDIVKGKEFVDNSITSYDLVVALDCGDISRIYDPNGLFANAKTTINIDHHISNDSFAMYNYVDANASSTCELVYDVLEHNIRIDKDMAEALYMGIFTDTGGFRYSATSPKTMSIVSSLMERQIDFGAIQEKMMYAKTPAQVAAFTTALGNLAYIGGNIAYTTLTIEEMAKAGANRGDLQGIVEYLRNIDKVEIAVFFSELEGGYTRASFRSNGADVNLIASQFGGGGHKFAAAASFEAPFEEGVAQVLEVLKNHV